MSATFTDIEESKNGVGTKGDQTTWTAARNATSGSAISYTSLNNRLSAIATDRQSEKGTVYFGVRRTFFFFDLSSIPSGNTITGIELKVKGYGGGTAGNGDVRVAKSTAFGTNGSSFFATTDFDNWSPSSPTPYASNVSSWSYVSRNNITLNATAISDADTNRYLNLVLVDNEYDYPDTAPTSNFTNNNGITFRSSTSSEKNIVTVEHSAPPTQQWEGTINGQTIKVQYKINGVDVGDIVEINGTDGLV